MSYFIQDQPVLENQFEKDEVLQEYIESKLSIDIKEKWRHELFNFGETVINDIMQYARSSSANEPELMQYDSWGNRIDVLKIDPGWIRLKEISAEEGLVALGYDQSLGELGRVIQFIKLYLFTPSSAFYTCPLAMTDGAAQILVQLGDEDMKSKYLSRILSRDPNEFWVSGQWMTEKTGGSDLAETETKAEQRGDVWELTGPKWFTSAITADMTMTLAREVDKDGNSTIGSKGLSIFLLELKNQNGEYNNLKINRLKDKLGTRALPTGEVDLIGSKAHLIGIKGNGIKHISIMLNITRIYNSITAVSLMRRAYAIAKDYAHKRSAFGKYLIELPLHKKTLADSYVQFVGSFHLTFYVVELLGKKENQTSTIEENLMLRLLTPIVKLFTAKVGIGVISELLECMGGIGYLEDSNFPELLRDAQVLSIWEGTTNVLSLDVLRSIYKENSFSVFAPVVNQKLDSITLTELSEEVSIIRKNTSELVNYYSTLHTKNQDLIEAEAREFSFNIAKLITSTLLIEFSNQCSNKLKYMKITKSWILNNPITEYSNLSLDEIDTILN